MRNFRNPYQGNYLSKEWRWNIFLEETIKAISPFKPKEYSIDNSFLSKQSTFGSKSKPQVANTFTWACTTNKLRLIRAACVEAGSTTQVFNLLMCPYDNYELPFFGADFVSLPSGYLLALDLQPILRDDESHDKSIKERLLKLNKYWQPLFPYGGEIPAETRKYFSPGLIWTRFPLGPKGDKLIADIMMPAYLAYLSLYLELVTESSETSAAMSKILNQGQEEYMRFRAEKDPARGMLQRFYGSEWTEMYINNILFSIK